MVAAQWNAFLPPGISRHIVQGRALRVNYPLKALCDSSVSLEAEKRQPAGVGTKQAGKSAGSVLC